MTLSSGIVFSASAEDSGNITEEINSDISGAPEVKAPATKLIALTFDDGPGKDTARLLNGLREMNAHCTFFMVGSYVRIYPQVVKQCYEDGHQLASHSYDHSYLTSLSDSGVKSQLSQTASAIDSAVGAPNTYMVRPPYGAYNNHVLSLLGVPAFYWSDDAGDWRTQNTTTIYNNMMNSAQDGDILLLHDSHSWSVDVALRFVKSLQEKGYEFVTLSELFRRRGVALQAGKIYSSCRDNGTNLPGISAPIISEVPTAQGMTVTMSADPGTKIYYTTDGSVPNPSSKVYTAPILIKGKTSFTAVAGYDMNGSRSKLTRKTVEFSQAAAPKMTINADGTVMLTAADKIFYTIDGTLPTPESTPYTGPFQVPGGTYVRAIAFTPGGESVPSVTVSLLYSHNGNVFDDVLLNEWFYKEVDHAVTAGLMVGTAENHFAPNESANRAMMATVLYRIAGEPTPKQISDFQDVPEQSWYANAVSWAQEEGIVYGVSDSAFMPTQAITREQAVAILHRYAKSCGYRSGTTGDLSSFKDAGEVSRYAREDMRWAVSNGFIVGDKNGNLLPKGTITRAQLAAILSRYTQAAASWTPDSLTTEELRTLGNEALSIIKDQDYSSLAALIHPELGLTLTPYSTVSDSDITIASDEMEAAAADVETETIWGTWDGSGEPISMAFQTYWDRFVWNTDYSLADRIGYNEIMMRGNAVENVEQAYPDCAFIDFTVKHCSDAEDDTDWSSIKLVFQKDDDDDWYLIAIIHGEWTT